MGPYTVYPETVGQLFCVLVEGSVYFRALCNVAVSLRLRGRYRQKITKLKQKLLLMKYQHVADVVLEYNSCATFVKGV